MEKVKLMFSNIQSHENTTFYLQPGFNFILAEDNNVGKSTIFKVLTTIARAPNVSSGRIRALMRVGCDTSYAAFDYSDGRVVAWFKKEQGKAPHLFFEHIYADGDVVHALQCPASLLQALGIAVSDDGEIMNFNDADSVQLISETSVEADKILTHVILDPHVELMKSNMLAFYRQLEADNKAVGIRLEDAQALVRDLDYNPLVDEFFKQQDELAAMCRACDILEPVGEISELLRGSGGDKDSWIEEGRAYARFVELFQDTDFTAFEQASCDLVEIEAITTFLELFSAIDFKLFEQNEERVVNLPRMRLAKSGLLKVNEAVEAIARFNVCTDELIKTRRERIKLRNELGRLTVEVECPVKGQVFYSDEGCLPAGD